MQPGYTVRQAKWWFLAGLALAVVFFAFAIFEKGNEAMAETLRGVASLCLAFWFRTSKRWIANILIVAFFIFLVGPSIIIFQKNHDLRALIGDAALYLLLAMGFYVDRKKKNI